MSQEQTFFSASDTVNCIYGAKDYDNVQIKTNTHMYP